MSTQATTEPKKTTPILNVDAAAYGRALGKHQQLQEEPPRRGGWRNVEESLVRQAQTLDAQIEAFLTVGQQLDMGVLVQHYAPTTKANADLRASPICATFTTTVSLEASLDAGEVGVCFMPHPFSAGGAASPKTEQGRRSRDAEVGE